MTQKLTDLRGTPAFADVLAERERALGLVASTITSITATPTDEVNAADVAAATDGARDEDVRSEPLPEPLLDHWGNTIIGGATGIGSLGQYRIERVVPWSHEPVILRVCGEAASEKHLLWWDYDEGERRMVCALCFSREVRL